MIKLPIIAISTGDPAGIGPEITIMALGSDVVYGYCRPLVVGDARVIRQAIRFCGAHLEVNVIEHPGSGKYRSGTLDVIDLTNADPASFSIGKVSAITGKASFEYVKKVIDLALENRVDATVTGPINKEAIHAAGIPFAGHTEIFAHYTKSLKYAMMLAEGSFRVVHVNTHVSLIDSIKGVTRERVLRTILLTHEALQRMGIDKPRIAVNGLNPHAGENGLFGNEEIEHILPAINDAKLQGIMADGPHPPDTVFPKMRGGQYDAVVCMYHDQGHIPTKLLGFQYDDKTGRWNQMSGVNITLGLPIIRVLVDHGTAFDRAGQGTAHPGSMVQAIAYAAKFAVGN